jgi:hypothetical protein
MGFKFRASVSKFSYGRFSVNIKTPQNYFAENARRICRKKRARGRTLRWNKPRSFNDLI